MKGDLMTSKTGNPSKNESLDAKKAGELLRCFRVGSDMSMHDTAKALGIKHRNFICAIEHADSTPPLARIFDHCSAVSADVLMPLIVLKYYHQKTWGAFIRALDVVYKNGISPTDLDEIIDNKFEELVAEHKL
jgi:hypothetical protein